MGDYHFVYKDLEGASTQWDDIQRKLGNLPPKAPAFKPPPFTPASDDQPKDKTWIDSKTSEELEDLEGNLDDDRFLQEYRFCSASVLLSKFFLFCHSLRIMGCFLNLKGFYFVGRFCFCPRSWGMDEFWIFSWIFWWGSLCCFVENNCPKLVFGCLLSMLLNTIWLIIVVYLRFYRNVL